MIYTIDRYAVRPREYTLAARVSDPADTAITIDNVLYLMVGDLLQVDCEKMEVISHATVLDDVSRNGVISVRRGVRGTHPSPHACGSTVSLLDPTSNV